MALIVSQVTDPSDFERIMPLDYDAWRTPYNPQLKHFRPDHLSRSEAIAYITAKYTKKLQDNNDPNCFMIKVTDANTQEIIGFAIWKLNEMTAEVDEKTVASYYPEGSEEREFAECFVDGLWGFIAERIKQRHMDLLSIVVHPSHRHRGAGRMLIRWGIDKADELGVETAISSLPSAKGAYERNGLGCIEVIPPSPKLEQRLEELEREGKGEIWRKLLQDDLSGWLMWRPVGRDWNDSDKAPWK